MSNPNSYAIFLVAVHGFILWQIITSRRLSHQILLVAVGLGCFVLTLTTGSRLGLAAIAVQIAFIILRSSRGRRVVLAATLTLGCVYWITAPYHTIRAEDYIPQDVLTTTNDQLEADLSESSSSAGIRVELYKSAAWFTFQSYGLGLGPGNFPAAMAATPPPYKTGETLAPHNFFLELLAEFGVVVALAFIAFLTSLIRRAQSLPKQQRVVITAMFLGLTVASLANSSYLISSVMWAMFATLIVVIETSPRRESER